MRPKLRCPRLPRGLTRPFDRNGKRGSGESTCTFGAVRSSRLMHACMATG